MTPLERADNAREEWSSNRGQHLVAEEFIPPGSLIFRDEAEMLAYMREKGFVPLTPDEAEKVRLGVEFPLAFTGLNQLSNGLVALRLLSGKGQA